PFAVQRMVCAPLAAAEAAPLPPGPLPQMVTVRAAHAGAAGNVRNSAAATATAPIGPRRHRRSPRLR
ncbi:MAG TPA: hypothetical protein VGV67_09730, partial [Solirubrobacteraceae bacterium]|nr:hypothetical protein [Solirubrobacteraceae bacterium]